LILSVSTVKTHVEHIIAKLEVADRTQAAVKATRLGIVGASSEGQLARGACGHTPLDQNPQNLKTPGGIDGTALAPRLLSSLRCTREGR
jgi:hypothetical protein